MPAPEPTPVDKAFAVITEALKTEAVRGDFARTAAFLQHIQRLQERWTTGQPPHTPRSSATKPAAAPQPEADPPPSSLPSNG